MEARNNDRSTVCRLCKSGFNSVVDPATDQTEKAASRRPFRVHLIVFVSGDRGWRT